MEWVSFRSEPSGAGAVTLDYYPVASSNNPLYLIGAENVQLVKATGKGVPGFCTFTLQAGGNRQFGLKVGYLDHGSQIWSGRLPLSTDMKLSARFDNVLSTELVEFHALVANKDEVF
tara:strand:+ start:1901 stop:2251 length:351 start_codon:yes stop_codon:yes gene_type:complete